jgi:hypothetical protein
MTTTNKKTLYKNKTHTSAIIKIQDHNLKLKMVKWSKFNWDKVESLKGMGNGLKTKFIVTFTMKRHFLKN